MLLKHCYLGQTKKEETRWPRVVEESLKRHNHIVCRMCTQRGNLEEIVVTKKDKELYKYVKSLSYGQRATLNFEDKPK